MLAASLLGLALVPGLVRAQDTYQFKYDKEANPKTDFRHGRRLQFEMNGAKVEGVVVRADSKVPTDVYLRTDPRLAPQKYSLKGIPVKVGEQYRVSKDGIVLASTAKSYFPEIQELVIYNGKKKTTSYLAPSLSPGEMSTLRELELAQNEVARLERLQQIQNQVLETDLAIQEGQQRAQDLMNDLLWKREIPGGYRISTINSDGIATIGYGPVAFTPYALNGLSGIVKDTLVQGNYATTPVPFVRVGSVFPGLPVAGDALAKAEQRLVSLQDRGVYEDGQLVAVITDK
jgi:hypothetical protein